MVKVLFVCMGNICRSPTAQGVFFKLLRQEGLTELVYVDSAGTHAYHVGEPPDERAIAAALKRGIDLRALRARTALPADFEQFDYVLAMDRQNYRHLRTICPAGLEHKLKLFLEYAPHLDESEVPDPYYGAESGFERVMDLVEAAAVGLVAEIRNRWGIQVRV